MALSRKQSSAIRRKRSLIAYSHPESIFSEQYRMIQANIRFSMGDQKSRSFLITSPSNEEGKSWTAANLAVSIAKQKENVLLIDANLRNPSLHDIFKVQNSLGLTDILTGRMSLFDVIYHTEIGRLDLITSGSISVNPGELLSSHKMGDILKTSLNAYDMVLIDSHSVLELTDTKLLANQCDGVVLVIQSGKTKQAEAIEAKKVLEFAKAKMIGVIINE